MADKALETENTVVRVDFVSDASRLVSTMQDIRVRVDQLKKDFMDAFAEIGVAANKLAQKVNVTSESIKIMNLALRQVKETEALQAITAKKGFTDFSGVDPVKLGADIYKFNAEIASMKAKILDMVVSINTSFANVGTSVKRLATDARVGKNGLNVTTIATKELTTEQKNLEAQIRKLLTEQKKLEDAQNKGAKAVITAKQGFIQQALAIVGITSAVQVAVDVIRKLVSIFTEAAQSAYEFSKAIFQIEVAIGALNRSNIAITTQEVYDNLDKLQKKFGVFSKKELVEGSAAFFNLNRDMGLTKEQLFILQDAIATLAVVNGRSMEDVQRTAALALASGYTEGLQRLGVSINRVSIAMEAQRLGWGRNYMSLTEQQRATATYNLLIQKTLKYGDDLVQYQKTLPGQIDVTTAAIKDQTVTLGEEYLPMLLLVKKAWLEILGILIQLPKSVTPEYKGTAKGHKYYDYSGDFEREMLRAQNAFEAMLPDIFTEEQMAKYEKFFRDMLELSDAHRAEETKAEEEFNADMADIDAEGLQKREELWADYLQKIADINLKYQQDITDTMSKYQFDLSELGIDTNQKLADANQKFHEEQVNAEKDYQDQLRKLREEYLFDLESAIEARDARAILTLIRRYNLDRKQLLDKKKSDEEDRKDTYEDEIKDIKEQAARKAAEMARELEFKLAQMAIDAQRERDAAQLDYDKELKALNDSIKNERTARIQAYADLKADQDKAFVAKMAKLKADFEGEKALTKSQLAAMYKLYYDMYGPGGDLAKLYAWIKAQDPGGAVLGPGVGQSQPELPPPPDSTVTGTVDSVTTTSSRMAKLLPLSKLNYTSSRTGVLSGVAGNSGGRMTIALSLPPEWKAEIVDNALGQMADVILEVQRER